MPYVGKKATNAVDVAESQSLTIDDNLTTPSINSGQIGGRRNLAYNGAMKIAQRGTQTGQTSGDYTACDRFRIVETGDAVVTTSQSTDVPSGQGFANSLKIDVTTADASVAASDQYRVEQRLEGQDLQHLLYGTSGAKDLTISFWVKSPKTGTHILELRHNDATYFNSQAYTISSADTWQKVTLTFSGYTTTAFDDDAAFSLGIEWYLMAGSDKTSGTLNSNTWHNTEANRAVGQVNCVDSDANNFYLTGVQVEVGSVGTEFEHRSFGEELALCQRYYRRMERADGSDSLNAIGRGVAAIRIGLAQVQSTTRANGVIEFPVAMRAVPTLELSAVTDIDFAVTTNTPPATDFTLDSATSYSVQNAFLRFTDSTAGLTVGQAGRLQFNAAEKHIAFDAEL